MRDQVTVSTHKAFLIGLPLVVGLLLTPNQAEADCSSHYLPSVRYQGRYMAWQKTQFPLSIHVQDDSLKPIVKQAFEAWAPTLSAALGKPATISFIDHSDQAAWQVSLRDWIPRSGGFHATKHASRYRSGLTRLTSTNNHLQQMHIQVARIQPDGRPHSTAELERIMTHELGHALGLLGHSPNPSDLMSASQQSLGWARRVSRVSTTGPSLRDRCTLSRLYAQ